MHYHDACFIVKDANGLPVAYVYYEEEPGRRAAANLLTKDEARRIAANIVKLTAGQATDIAGQKKVPTTQRTSGPRTLRNMELGATKAPAPFEILRL